MSKNYEIISIPVPLLTPWYGSATPHLFHPPIIHNYNTMDTEFLVQMRESNKCKNDEIFNLHLGSGAVLELASPASCKMPATFVDSIRPNN